jgi:hypothetical protein
MFSFLHAAASTQELCDFCFDTTDWSRQAVPGSITFGWGASWLGIPSFGGQI